MSGDTLNGYQSEVMRTAASDSTPEMALAVLALGVAGEAGEVADLLKKHLGHGHPLDRDKAAKELGDVLWYVAALANRLGFSLEEVARLNVAKLRARYPEGFDPARSLNRQSEGGGA